MAFCCFVVITLLLRITLAIDLTHFTYFKCVVMLRGHDGHCDSMAFKRPEGIPPVTPPSAGVQQLPAAQAPATPVALVHGVASATLLCAQPLGALQKSAVHGLASSQFGAPLPATQPPPLHLSFKEQAFPSLHAAVLLMCTQPLVGSHLSSVHGLLSSQFMWLLLAPAH